MTGQTNWWFDMDKIQTLTNSQKKFLVELKKSDLGDGLVIPTFGPNNQNGFFGLGSGTSERNFTDFEISMLHHYCQTIHLSYCKRTTIRRANSQLTNKEIEVMKQVALGLSTSDIAKELGVTSNTVNTHLKRVYHKFEVTDRVSATLRFLAHGYIYQ